MATGLSTDELTTIRDGLAAGRKPRVQFTEAAGQISGQIGQVVSLADPAVSDEWVVVRFGRDELPFSPSDLRVAPRGVAARKAVVASVPPRQPAPPAPEFVIDKPLPVKYSVPPPAGGGTSVAGSGGVAAVPGSPPPRKSGEAVPGAVSRESDAVSRESDAIPRESDAIPRKSASRPVKAKPSPSLTVTLAYGEGEWTVAAAQGSKVLAKPYVIRPAEALRMVSLVDMPGVQEAVEHIMAAERAEASQQADRLRAQLAEVEARLAELGEAP